MACGLCGWGKVRDGLCLSCGARNGRLEDFPELTGPTDDDMDRLLAREHFDEQWDQADHEAQEAA